MNEIIRKSQTGEAGNAGEFGTHTRAEDELDLSQHVTVTTPASSSAPERNNFSTLYDSEAIAAENAAWAEYRKACRAIEALDPFATFNSMSRDDIEGAINDLMDKQHLTTSPSVRAITEHAQDFRRAAGTSIDYNAEAYFDGVRDVLADKAGVELD